MFVQCMNANVASCVLHAVLHVYEKLCWYHQLCAACNNQSAMLQELEQELEPKEEAIENLNNQLQEQDGELVEQLKGAGVSTPCLTPLLVVTYHCRTTRYGSLG